MIENIEGLMNHLLPSLRDQTCSCVELVKFSSKNISVVIPPPNLTSNLEFHILFVFTSLEFGLKF